MDPLNLNLNLKLFPPVSSLGKNRPLNIYWRGRLPLMPLMPSFFLF